MKNTLTILILLMVTGCATITRGVSQPIVFRLDPKEATCSVVQGAYREIGTISQGQNTLKVGKSKDDILVRCEAPGFAPKTLRVVSVPYGGILWLTDLATGAYWEYPGVINITLEK